MQYHATSRFGRKTAHFAVQHSPFDKNLVAFGVVLVLSVDTEHAARWARSWLGGWRERC